MSILRWAVLVSVLIAGIAANARDRDWQIGTLINTREQSETGSNVTTERGSVPGIVSGGTYNRRKETYAVDTVWQEYAIKGNGFGYEAKQPLQWRWSKAAVLTIGGPVVFAVEGRSLYLIDDTGKEYKLELIRRVGLPVVSKPSSQTVPQATSAALTNADVRRLKEAGVSDTLLVEKIKSSVTAFKLDTDDLLELKTAGVSDAVIAAMLQAQNVKQ